MWVYILHKMAPQSAIDIALKGIRKKAMEMQKAKSRTIKDSGIARL